MKKNIKLILITVISVILVITLSISIPVMKKNLTTKTSKNNLINISNLSEKFMENYFEKSKEIKEEDKKNILIVISKEKIENGYGASQIIESPNNQYLLQYNSEKEKEDALNILKQDNSIINVEENLTRSITEISTTSTDYNSWGIEKMGLDYALDIANKNELEDVTAAIIDTGLNMELFKQHYQNKINGTYNVLTKNEDMSDNNSGHGTHIAGTIAEGTPSNVKILPIKVTETGKDIYLTDILAAINYITYYEKADVINMSYTGYGYVEAEYLAIEAAKEKNIISVCAAGNENVSINGYPAAYDNTISISAVDTNLEKASFSNYGPKISFSAPGTDILSINGTSSGTSMATPHAVSAVALLKGFNNNLTLENTMTLLKKSSLDLGSEDWDNIHGYGFINFNGIEFCEGTNCDQFNVFKNIDNNTPQITKIEINSIITPAYNYGNITNIIDSELKLYYDDNNYYIKTLGELGDDIEIIGYDPSKYEVQTITIKYKNLETTMTINNSNAINSGWEYEVLDETNIKLTAIKQTKQNYYPTVIYIPEEIDGYQVNILGEELFRGKVSLKKVTMPNTVTQIEEYVFWNCTNMEFIGLSENLEQIDKSAFYKTQNLYTIKLPESLTEIGESAFKESGIKDIKIPNSITKINNETFYNCVNLEEIILPEGLIEIGEQSFFGTESLNTINLPESLLEIGRLAFIDGGLTEIEIPKNIKRINDNTFASNHNLKNVILPEGLEEIGYSAFFENKIESLHLPTSLKKIEDQAFVDNNISELNIPENLEEIGAFAFIYNNIKSITIPKTVIKIGNNPFFLNEELNSITIDSENEYYTSENGSNVIVEKSTNTLITAITNSKIPPSTKIIGKNAITSDNTKIVIPNGVTEIKDYAFGGFKKDKLNKIVIPNTVTNFSKESFKVYNYVSNASNPYYEKVYPNNLVLWVYNNSPVKTFAIEQDIDYMIMEPTSIKVNLPQNIYSAFDTVETKNLSMEIKYQGTSTFTETITKGYTIKYNNGNDSFRYGDTSFTIIYDTENNYHIEEEVAVTVNKKTPEYTVPTNLTAKVGQKLSDVKLPDNFEWMDDNQEITELGNQIYKVKYVPTDTNNYKTIENIDVTILVKEGKIEIIPNISIKDKTYDGTLEIPVKNIIISNLDSSDYIVTKITLSSKDVGNRTATIKIKLTDEKFKTHEFEDGLQEKEFTTNIKILPQIINKPTIVEKEYVYNGNNQRIELNGFNDEVMNIEGGERVNAGEQEVIISLKNSNYMWSDNTTNEVVLKFKIEKADSKIKYTTSDNIIKYDGKSHGININVESPSNAIIKYMDSNGKYTLDEMPKYKEVGEYTIKYKIYIDENYTEIIDQATLIINKNTIINNTKDYEGFYDGKEHTINIDIDLENYDIKYSINNTDYNLTELPKFKNIGEYTINYKITSTAHEALTGSNKVKIYGIKEFDSTLIIKDNILISKNNSFSNLTNKIKTYSKTTTYNHYNKNNLLETTDIIKTGDIININLNNSKDYKYNISILGDINSDGKISSADYVKIRKHIMKAELIENEIYIYAADINNDNKISSADYVKIRKYIMNGESL